MGYTPSEAMMQHMRKVEENPDQAFDLTPELRRELEGISQEDLAEMARSVRVQRGAPIHLTDEQNAQFRQQNQHMPTFSKNVPKAPPGRFTGTSAGQESTGSMRDAWEKFGGSFEAFKAEVFKPVPADLRVGKQEWLVQGVVYEPGVAILNGGAFYDPEEAKAHAQRLQDVYPWFDFQVVSQWGWVPYPADEETMRGVQRTYRDKSLDAIMQEHFRSSTSLKQRQLAELKEVEERRGPRAPAEGEPEFPQTQVQVNMIDDEAAQGEVVAREK